MAQHHTLWQHNILKDGVRDRLGFAFFAFAALIAGFSAWQSPSILAWLYAFHNLLLAWFYMKREPAKRYDRVGLWLGLTAAMLPTPVQGIPSSWYLLIPGLLGYTLILWSLMTLGTKFGIAPADRGLTSRGPYQVVRHPMYLGELVFRATLLSSSGNLGMDSLFLFVILTAIQCMRILREERWISGYDRYLWNTQWRLIPLIW
ncbi:methyltransferase family protein [Anaerolinea sp.]|uniref:methyltransferase family protein n=1 Tax=Anaerolinea sp. TaxID=1872519 RepID=UPI002ACE51F5|nr:methyltransferase [Anaerolinea sp.]